jgi:gamma-glutamyl-gamma-aminobutyraldehyde dehydrogenase
LRGYVCNWTTTRVRQDRNLPLSPLMEVPMIDADLVNRLRQQAISPRKMLIGKDWRDAGTGETTQVISPIDGRPLTTLARGGAQDVDAAVAAARRCFDAGGWARCAPAERKKVLVRLADLIERNAAELAVLGIRDNGTEIGMALRAEPLGAATTFRYYAEAVDKVYGEIAPTAATALGLIHREPVGVVGAIVPWNMPLMIGAWKLAPALAQGNSVVLKPAEAASLGLLRLAELALEAGLPEGALNVVTGAGSIVGQALATHMEVDVIAFSGSNAVGRQLLEAAAKSNLKRVYLELGGKSPNIVFADAPDLEVAARAAANAIFRNSGQVCVAGSRLLVEGSIRDSFLERLVAVTEALRVGDPLDARNDIGAIINEQQLNQNLSHIARAQEEGARLLYGGERLLQETGGFYQRPAILGGVTPGMALAQQEVFGPVLAVLSFDTEAEAVALANATEYGLAAGVWTRDLSRAHRMVRSVRAGLVHVNTYGGSDLTVPLGGHGQSGNGHDKSLHALDKFTNIKSAWIQL